VRRRTVRQALANAVPPERKTPVRVAPKLDPAKDLTDTMLMLDLTAPRKQRHTARRFLAWLVYEHELADLTYSASRVPVATERHWPGTSPARDRRHRGRARQPAAAPTPGQDRRHRRHRRRASRH